MKVIKHGKKFDNGKSIKGTCDSCGCIVEVTRKEIRYTNDQRDGDYYFVKCPECDEIIYIKDKRLQ